MIKIILLILFFTRQSYSFYDMYGDIPYEYDMEFTGAIRMESKAFSYTNTNARFTFGYALENRSEYSTPAEIVVDWYFSNIRESNLPAIFSSIWSNYTAQQQKEVVYVIKTAGDNFFAFDTQGSIHPMSYFLNVLLPVVNFQTLECSQSYNFNLNNNQNEFFYVNIDAWEFYNITKTNDQTPMPALETNFQFIDKVYSIYAQKRAENQSTAFWLQNMSVYVNNAYGQIRDTADFNGIYVIDMDSRTLTQGGIIGKIDMTYPFRFQNFTQEIKIHIEGEFNLKLTPLSTITEIISEDKTIQRLMQQ